MKKFNLFYDHDHIMTSFKKLKIRNLSEKLER